MKTLKLRNHFQTNSTLIDNDFIDRYMVSANGEYVKVYLFLLRHLHNPCCTLSLSMIADCLENTEKDILRALKYWEKEGLINLECDPLGKITGIDIGSIPESGISETEDPEPEPEPEQTAAPEPARSLTVLPDVKESPSPKAANIEQYRSRKEFKSLLFIAEQYLGKTLSPSDIEAITYFYDTLHFSADLVEYLIEYCVENGHKSMHYIQKVALSWSEEKICTVEQAKESSAFYNKNCYSVLNAFGIKGRAPAAPELTYIKKWTEEYGFSLELVVEACNRTMAKLHQPNFEYADSILKKWISSDVHHLSDVQRLDSAHRQAAANNKKVAARPAARNKFNNFEGHDYDYDSLEKQLLEL